jgi:hypothetical protein
MGKKRRDTGISLDSFLDILTCLQGVLMLIIITTGIDAAQTKVMVATPIELAGSERPIYIEARNNQLFAVPLAEARRAVNEKHLEVLKARRADSANSMVDMMEAVGAVDVTIGNYKVDFTRYLSGQIALMPIEGVDGYSFTNAEVEVDSGWFGRILNEMDVENERINFLVRDDSFDIFKLARFLAWTKKAKVTYSLIPRNDPLIF